VKTLLLIGIGPGDPTLYDGTLQTLRDLIDEGREDLAVEVIPGITCIQALTAKHRIPLNRVCEAVVITTGRQIESTDPAAVHNSIVMWMRATRSSGCAGHGSVRLRRLSQSPNPSTSSAGRRR